MMLTGVGGSGHQYSFVSTGTQYVGRTCAANSGYTATWTIGGVAYSGLNPGTVALSTDKTVYFDINPQSKLTAFDCGSNQLTGSIPSLTANTAMETLYCYSNQLTGSIPSLTANTALATFDCSGNQLTGSIPSLTANTAMATFDCSGSQLSGSIPSLTANTALVTLYCYNNQLTGVDAGFAVRPALLNAHFESNLLTQSAVDAILAAFVAAGGLAGALSIGGSGNATPSAAGLASKATLQGLGWTVVTN